MLNCLKTSLRRSWRRLFTVPTTSIFNKLELLTLRVLCPICPFSLAVSVAGFAQTELATD